MYLSDRGAKIQKDTFRYVVSKCIFSTRGRRYKKIHLDTWYLNVSFCIFPPRSERYIKIHKDTFRYLKIHSDAQTPEPKKHICQTFLWSLNSQIPGVKVTQIHCMWTSSPLMGTSGPQMRTSGPHKKTHAGKGCFYKTMFKLDRIYPYITKKTKMPKKTPSANQPQ